MKTKEIINIPKFGTQEEHMLDLLSRKETKIAAAIIAVIMLLLTVVLVVNQKGIKQTQNSLESEAGSELIVDTSALKVELACRYVFTNNVAEADLSTMIGSIEDASEYITKLIRFERTENLKELDENALKSLIEQINTHAKAEDLLKIGTEEVPTEEGIYRAVLEIADTHGNAAYEEVIVIVDMTGAKIEDVADKTVPVSKENLSAEPVVDKSDYIIRDNVDGKIAEDKIITELELRDEAIHEWLVHVSYVDRAGNESEADFLIIVKEECTSQSGSSGNGGASNQGSSANSGGSSNQSGNSNSDTNDKPENNLDVSTWNPEEYDENEINPYQQKIIDAGYGNVVDWGDGTYSVLVHADYTANGKDGYDILKEYLAERDWEIVQSYAGIIDEDDDWYVYSVSEVRELITPDEEEFWD